MLSSDKGLRYMRPICQSKNTLNSSVTHIQFQRNLLLCVPLFAQLPYPGDIVSRQYCRAIPFTLGSTKHGGGSTQFSRDVTVIAPSQNFGYMVRSYAEYVCYLSQRFSLIKELPQLHDLRRMYFRKTPRISCFYKTFPSTEILHIFCVSSRIQMPWIRTYSVVTMMQAKRTMWHFMVVNQLPHHARSSNLFPGSVDSYIKFPIPIGFRTAFPFPATIRTVGTMGTQNNSWPKSFLCGQYRPSSPSFSFFFLSGFAWFCT